jgi:hypothetical protein
MVARIPHPTRRARRSRAVTALSPATGRLGPTRPLSRQFRRDLFDRLQLMVGVEVATQPAIHGWLLSWSVDPPHPPRCARRPLPRGERRSILGDDIFHETRGEKSSPPRIAGKEPLSPCG